MDFAVFCLVLLHVNATCSTAWDHLAVATNDGSSLAVWMGEVLKPWTLDWAIEQRGESEEVMEEEEELLVWGGGFQVSFLKPFSSCMCVTGLSRILTTAKLFPVERKWETVEKSLPWWNSNPCTTSHTAVKWFYHQATVNKIYMKHVQSVVSILHGLRVVSLFLWTNKANPSCHTLHFGMSISPV